jgi:flagellar export protein FliJ
MMKLRDAERYRDDLIARRDALRERLSDHHAEMELPELRAAYAHCDYLDREIVAQHDVVRRVSLEAEGERMKLVAATKDKRVLETLKTRRRETFEAEAAAVERNSLDDINARTFDRAQTHRETPR